MNEIRTNFPLCPRNEKGPLGALLSNRLFNAKEFDQEQLTLALEKSHESLLFLFQW